MSGVYKLSNGTIFSREQFLDYVEKKVYKTIRTYALIKKEDVVCIATSGGKDSLAVLYMTHLFCKQHKVPFFALAIDEGIAGYRDHTLDDLRSFCDKYDVTLHVASFLDYFGDTLDNLIKRAMVELNKKPCTVCGIFRRTLLNRKARELGATKLVTGHNLDDESQVLLMNTLLGNMRHNASLGPATGLNENNKFVPRVKPLYFISEKETRLYAFLRGFIVHFSECPNIGHSYRAVIRDQLNLIEEKFPGSKHGIVNSFLDIAPELKGKYKSVKEFNYCKDCGDPCAKEICNSCQLVKDLCLDVKK
jgi:tRNA-5-methyluridine54 2-sulfurtransferase